jgi:antitoxin ParD1/3/4
LSGLRNYHKLINIDKEAAMPSSYAIGKHYEAFVKRLVDSGRYASASEVIRAALRDMEEKVGPPVLTVKDIRAAIKEAEDDPRPPIPLEDVMQQLDRLIDSIETQNQTNSKAA